VTTIRLDRIEDREDLETLIEEEANIIINNDWENQDKELHRLYINESPDFEPTLLNWVQDSIDNRLHRIQTFEQAGLLLDILENIEYIESDYDDLLSHMKVTIHLRLTREIRQRIREKLDNMEDKKKTAIQI
jgi:hypothetical protein